MGICPHVNFKKSEWSHGAEKNRGSAGKDHLDLERPGDKGLMVASWGINRAKVPFGRLVLKKEETHSLKVNEKGHKVKMKFIMFLIFFDFFFDFCFFK